MHWYVLGSLQMNADAELISGGDTVSESAAWCVPKIITGVPNAFKYTTSPET